MVFIYNYLLQIVCSVGVIVGFGVVINFLNRGFYRVFGRMGYRVCVATGFVGTPVHELSHAAMCLLFGHKILKIKLFPSVNGERTLGYVNHSYNKKNLYHMVGNFFIGVAPVIFGSLAIYLLMLIFSKSTFDGFMNAFLLNGADEWQVGLFFKSLILAVGVLFKVSNLTKLGWWIFIVLASSISIHMSVSPADIRASKTGFLFVAVLLFAVNLAFYLFEQSIMLAMSDVILRYSVFLISFLSISIILCLGLFLLALIIRPIFSLKS